MTDTKQAWNDVAEEFSDLGLKLKHQFEGVQARPDETVKTALGELRDALDQAFTAIGKVIEDPTVKEDVHGVARSLRAALSATFTEASSDLRHCFAEMRHHDGGTAR